MSKHGMIWKKPGEMWKKWCYRRRNCNKWKRRSGRQCEIYKANIADNKHFNNCLNNFIKYFKTSPRFQQISLFMKVSTLFLVCLIGNWLVIWFNLSFILFFFVRGGEGMWGRGLDYPYMLWNCCSPRLEKHLLAVMLVFFKLVDACTLKTISVTL